MMELFSFDDVGQAYDIALGEDGRVGVTLGRHTSDYITSFYSFTPSASWSSPAGRPLDRCRDVAGVRTQGRPQHVGP